MTTGLYGKYIITKADGSPVDPNADYFVLRLDADQAAQRAALSYADAVGENDLELAQALRKRVLQHCKTDTEIEIGILLEALELNPLDIYKAAPGWFYVTFDEPLGKAGGALLQGRNIRPSLANSRIRNRYILEIPEIESTPDK